MKPRIQYHVATGDAISVHCSAGAAMEYIGRRAKDKKLSPDDTARILAVFRDFLDSSPAPGAAQVCAAGKGTFTLVIKIQE